MLSQDTHVLPTRKQTEVKHFKLKQRSQKLFLAQIVKIKF